MAPMKRMLNSLNPMKSHGGAKEKNNENKEKSGESKEKSGESKEKNSETNTTDIKEGETATSPPIVEDKHNSQDEVPSV